MSGFSKILLVTAAIVTPVAAHAVLALPEGRRVAAAWLAVQIVAITWLLLRGERGVLRFAAGGVALALVALFASRLSIVAVTGLSHALIYAGLLAYFLRSLRAPEGDVVLRLANALRGPLTPAMAAYATGATRAWCCFFAAQIIVSGLLLAFADTATWSFFVNVLDVPLLAAMFALEWCCRRLRFGPASSAGLGETVAAFRALATRTSDTAARQP